MKNPAAAILGLAATRLVSAGVAGFLLLTGCAKDMMRKPEQGIYGTFLAYGPPRDPIDCAPMKTQMEKDECRRFNSRLIEEPHQAQIKVRNLQTGDIQSVPLDAAGKYKVKVDPGEYEVCVEGECSDPIPVKMNSFVTYGQRLPRAVDTAQGEVRTPIEAAR